MSRTTTRLRALLRRKGLITAPSAYDALTARMVRDAGFDAVCNGGFVTGGSTCISEPLPTMRDQVEVGQRSRVNRTPMRTAAAQAAEAAARAAGRRSGMESNSIRSAPW